MNTDRVGSVWICPLLDRIMSPIHIHLFWIYPWLSVIHVARPSFMPRLGSRLSHAVASIRMALCPLPEIRAFDTLHIATIQERL